MPWASASWETSLRPIEEQGYVCVAVNSSTTDYVIMAQRMFASLKHWHPGARTCLITDIEVHHDEFDHVRVIEPNTNPYANDFQAWRLTPFRETIKLEADMLIVSEIDHWWTLLRNRDLVITTGCLDWCGRPGQDRSYRQCFDHNDLPDVYNAITYWRRSELARDFFELVRSIFQNWNSIKPLLRYPEDVPSTDLVYAIAAKVLGPESVTLPFVSYPRITHMRPRIAGTESVWWQELVWESHAGRLRINTVPQWGAFHYNDRAHHFQGQIKVWQP